MTNAFDYFNKIYCINLDARKDRWESCKKEFLAAQIEVERFSAVKGESPVIAFNTSQAAVIAKALEDGCENTLILEDDVKFKGDMHLHYAMNELPADWDSLYLGGNIIGIDTIPFQPPFRFSSHLFCLIDCWQTHAVAYSRKGMEFIRDNFKADNGYIFDEWLRKNMLPRRKSFIIAPQIAYQRASFSDIWNVQANFEHLFEAGNKLLL